MHRTLVVVDQPCPELDDPHFALITFEQYLADYPKRNEPKTRLINLCDTEHYLSRGYYCSLLAEARQHRVLPSVRTINDLRESGQGLTRQRNLPLLAAVVPAFAEAELSCWVFFGWTEQPALRKLARVLFDQYRAPILQVTLSQTEQGLKLAVAHRALAQLSDALKPLFYAQLQQFTQQVWRSPSRQRQQRWDMAILVNPEESYPPSDEEAIKRFIKAAAKVGIHAELITAAQADNIAQYDALFIRETTAIDHPTYRIAVRAEREGLVVIDDPTSILRCCNKVYLHDAFSYNGVPSLKTQVISSASEETLDQIEAAFAYPLVLKMPEGSFSRGVYKIRDRQELQQKVSELLESTALLLVQEYLYTDFDWRIGVLNGKALYACRYHMARNHWQIYNHSASKRNSSGGFETLPTFEVPKRVLDAAIKAANMVGKGLYGVDLKQKDKQVYVIEVNDNPSLDYKVEDKYLGNELYMQVMAEFAARLELRGRRNS